MSSPRLPRRLSPWPSPAALLARAFATTFNHVMRGQGLARRLRELDGKRIRLHAEDLPWALELRVDGGILRVAEPGGTPNVTIRGNLADLHRLAKRSEDADTLFFERRLSIEGETQTGLLIKNMLDALDWSWDAHVRAVLPLPLATLAIAGGHLLRTRDSQSTARPSHSMPAAPRRNPSQ
jgi:predicted lipid carrier protein YhbT